MDHHAAESVEDPDPILGSGDQVDRVGHATNLDAAGRVDPHQAPVDLPDPQVVSICGEGHASPVRAQVGDATRRTVSCASVDALTRSRRSGVRYHRASKAETIETVIAG